MHRRPPSSKRKWREGTNPPLSGYSEEHLRDAWARYLLRLPPSEAKKSETSETNDNSSGTSGTCDVSDKNEASETLRNTPPAHCLVKAVKAPAAEIAEAKRLYDAQRQSGSPARTALPIAQPAPTPKLELTISEAPLKPLKPWIEVALPHPDVLANRFKEAEFAANLAAVDAGLATEDYGTPENFFRITYPTEGLKRVLTSVLQRFSGSGGDPVIGLQTAFGGGKTHTMLAAYHLATASGLTHLEGVAPLAEKAGVTKWSPAKTAVFVGSAEGPDVSLTLKDGPKVYTPWGYIAWRLAGDAGLKHMQQIPDEQRIPGLPSFRTLFVAKPGCTLIVADWASMEMRAAAYISGDATMTRAFERGEDLHRLTAATMLRVDPKKVTVEQRKHAKPVNFGRLYGQGAAGLTEAARSNYGIILDCTTAEEWIRAFRETYPDYTAWCRRFAKDCERAGEIVIGREGGRVHEIRWNPEGYRYTQCLNLPIQGICADIAMLALAMIDRWLFEVSIEGGPVAWLHDEIVLEVPVADADKAAALLRKAMTEAFLESLPGAPTRGLVEPTIGRNWAEAKRHGRHPEQPTERPHERIPDSADSAGSPVPPTAFAEVFPGAPLRGLVAARIGDTRAATKKKEVKDANRPIQLHPRTYSPNGSSDHANPPDDA